MEYDQADWMTELHKGYQFIVGQEKDKQQSRTHEIFILNLINGWH